MATTMVKLLAFVVVLGLADVCTAAAPASNCVIVTNVASQDIKLEAHGADSIRVRTVQHAGVFRDDLVSALVEPVDAHHRAVGECDTIDFSHAVINFTNGNLMAQIQPSGSIFYVRLSDGKVLLREQYRVLKPTVTSPPLPGFFSLDLAFYADETEEIYGLGQHASFSWDPLGSNNNQLNMKGVKGLLMAPHDGEVLIPIAHSNLGYSFLFNLPSLGNLEYNDTISYWHAIAVMQVDMWVSTTADSPPHATSPWAQLTTNYIDATGHAPVWPEWSTGFWQCKLRYANQTQIMDVVQGYIDRQIPIALIIIDFFNWNDPLAPEGHQNTLGDETLPKTCWPDAKGMVDNLKDMGVELMISPYSHSISNTSVNWQGAQHNHLLALDHTGAPALGYAGGFVYDLFNEDARTYAWDAMDRGYVQQYGLHHWWLDCDEPCGGTNNGSFANDWVYNNGAWPASFVGAAYPQMVDKMVYEGMGAPGKEFANDNVMLGRAAWAGSQRYGGGLWSGDTQSTWKDFNEQFRTGLNVVMSGMPYWTTDIGGFAGANNNDDGFRELVVRWFQWGAFCPLFRLHGDRSGAYWPPNANNDKGICGGTASNEIWSFGNESEAAITTVMRIREQLRPYIMQQFELTSKDGTPIMRPLYYDFWDEEIRCKQCFPGALIGDVSDQLMFGPDYLVAPVLNQGQTSRMVYLPKLPKDQVWVNYFTKQVYDTRAEGVNISEATPLTGPGFSTFPLYQRKTTSSV
eukprot:m.211742 g.211742  ORF g.211742 m.211742 type:complete len:742 (+) comp33109_c0_seq2:2296-4521(+)